MICNLVAAGRAGKAIACNRGRQGAQAIRVCRK